MLQATVDRPPLLHLRPEQRCRLLRRQRSAERPVCCSRPRSFESGRQPWVHSSSRVQQLRALPLRASCNSSSNNVSYCRRRSLLILCAAEDLAALHRRLPCSHLIMQEASSSSRMQRQWHRLGSRPTLALAVDLAVAAALVVQALLLILGPSRLQLQASRRARQCRCRRLAQALLLVLGPSRLQLLVSR